MLIFGIDGATWSVLDQAIDQGYMPFLKSFLNKGTKAVLKSTQPPLTPAAWASFHMSRDPGSHGIVDFVAWNKQLNHPELVDSTWIGETVWQRLENKNLKTTLINVPMTYPTTNIAAQVISGLLTPDADSPWAYPKNLKSEILEDIPDYQPINLAHQSADEIEADIEGFLEFAKNCIRLRKELALWFIKKDLQDILVTQFQVIDWVQHALWYGLDPQMYNFKPQLQKKIFDRVYRTVDNAMEEIHKNWNKSPKKVKEAVVLSDHGFQSHKKRILLGNYFYKIGYLDKRAGLKSKISAYLPQTTFTENNSPIELLGRSQWGYAYLRKPHKIKKVFQELKKACDQLVDPETQLKVIKKVHLSSDLYKENHKNLLPEFLIEPIDGYSITASIDKSGNLFELVKRGVDFHIGIHHLDGIIGSNFKTTLPDKISEFGNWLEKFYE